jgi:hypothetical protein
MINKTSFFGINSSVVSAFNAKEQRNMTTEESTTNKRFIIFRTLESLITCCKSPKKNQTKSRKKRNASSLRVSICSNISFVNYTPRPNKVNKFDIIDKPPDSVEFSDDNLRESLVSKRLSLVRFISKRNNLIFFIAFVL